MKTANGTHVNRCDYPGLSLVIVTINGETRNFEFTSRNDAIAFARTILNNL